MDDLVRSRYLQLVQSIGKSYLHWLFPNDFEYYICSIELAKIKDNGDTITTDLFVFPVMPEQIQYTSSKITNIKKSAGGITSLKTDSFIPKQYVLSGNFGKKFKMLIGQTEVEGGLLHLKFPFHLKHKYFDPKVKTGYGAIKLFEHLYEKSSGLSHEGYPYRTYFYNPSLGHSWIVELTDLKLSQSKDLNMIWTYSLSLSAVSPIYEKGHKRNSLRKTLMFDNMTKVIDLLASEVALAVKYPNSDYNLFPANKIPSPNEIGNPFGYVTF